MLIAQTEHFISFAFDPFKYSIVTLAALYLQLETQQIRPNGNCLSNAGNGIKTLLLYRYDSEGQKYENITDWALNQFQINYKGSNGAKITKQDIFFYVYAVFHSPQPSESD